MERQVILSHIRDLCDSEGREIKPERTAEHFVKLANLYQDNGKRSFTCKSALLNAALSRLTDPEARNSVENQIRALGKDLLLRCNDARNDNQDLLDTSRRILKKLKKQRSTVKEELRKITKISVESLEGELMNLEKDRIQTVRSLMRNVSEYYIDTMREVSGACLQALGKPPCKFCHFATGSLAREEVTLYSDFENGILLEDEAVPDVGLLEDQAFCSSDKYRSREAVMEYFRWYAVLYHVILLNLGQTPLHMIGIEGLNDQYSENNEDNWFYDYHTPSGIKFDSFLPFASKTPFGRKPTISKPYTTELILPVREMLKFLEENTSLAEGYHLSDMLVESRHVAGNKDLFDLYKKQSIKKMVVLSKCPEHIKTTTKSAKGDLEKFDLTPTFNTLGWKQHAKNLYYRSFSVYIPWITRLCGIFEYRNNFEAIEKLVQTNSARLSQEAKHNLLYAMAIANQLRLEIYSDRSRQSDVMVGAVHLLDKTEHIMNVFDAVGDRSALDCYEISMMLRSAVIDVVDVITQSLAKGELDVKEILTVLNEHVTKRGNLKLHGDFYRHFQNYEMAITCYVNELSRCRQVRSEKAREDEADILMALGLTQLNALQFEKSIEYCHEAIKLEKTLDRGEVSRHNIATVYIMLGKNYTELPPIRQNYGPCMEKGIRLWKDLRSSYPENKDYLKGLAEARDAEAFYLHRTQQYQESLEKYTEARKLFEEFYGEDAANNDTMKVQNGIGMCLLRLKRYNKAEKIFGDVIRLKQSCIGKEVADVNVSWYLRHSGDALTNLERFDEAIQSYKLSISMRKVAPGSEYDKFSAMANTTCRLADCFLRCRRHREALEAADEALLLVAHIPNTVRGKVLTDTAEKMKKDIQEIQKFNMQS